MSCFCVSNSSDSVYSGYLRWRMGLPLPPIPQEEESHVLKHTNKDILNDIVGVKNVNDLTLEETDNDNTPRRFRRRRHDDINKTDLDRSLLTSSSSKDFQENPLYLSSHGSAFQFNLNSNSTVDQSFKFPRFRDELFVPSNTESFTSSAEILNNNSILNPPEKSISSFLVNKFLSHIPEYSEAYCGNNKTNENATAANSLDNTSLNKANEPSATVTDGPPAIPPHRKPSTIFEESESECNTIKSEKSLSEKEVCTIAGELEEKTVTPIPIFSIKHGDIDKIISESISDYDYAYNKSWSKGVELNLSINLSESEKNKQNKEKKPAKPAEDSVDSINQFDDVTQSKTDQSHKSMEPLNVSVDLLTDDSEDFIHRASLPDMSPIPFLKLSSIEADALKGSPTKLSRSSQVSSSFAESETDSRNEPWDVIHGRFVKELTGTRFIDPSIINNNKPIIKVPSSDDQRDSPVSVGQRSRNHNSTIDSKNVKDGTRRYHINIDTKLPLEKQPWYHFYLTRSKAETLLSAKLDGSFLVRRSESNKNDYSLSLRHRGSFLHMKITKTNRGFILGEYSQPYQSIPHMLYHYCLTMVPVKGGEAACLKYAITKDVN